MGEAQRIATCAGSHASYAARKGASWRKPRKTTGQACEKRGNGPYMAGYEGLSCGNYQLLHLLGKGGFAEVYLGEHIYLKTRAAIKILHTRLGEEDQQRFLDEARLIAHLDHPHIVRVLDFGLEGDLPFLVLDYAPLGSVRHLFNQGSQGHG